MYVHPYFSLDKRRLKVKGSVLSTKGVEVVVCGVKKKTKKSTVLFAL